MRRTISVAVALIATLGCSPENGPPEGPNPIPFLALPTFFDCVAEQGVTVVAAHRGGPESGYPENALETLQRTWRETGAVLEIDITTSADGVLFLHHDDFLGRTTTGRGPANEMTWSELRRLSLKDPDGGVTAFGLAPLEDVLLWANDRAILELDIKRGTDYDDVARLVRRHGVEDQIIAIAYSEGQARALRRRFPKAMISVTVDDLSDIPSYEVAGFSSSQLLAWLGTTQPDVELVSSLGDDGIEAITGTLGPEGSLDRRAADTSSDAIYVELSRLGVDMIATDRPKAAHQALLRAGRNLSADTCRSERSGQLN